MSHEHKIPCYDNCKIEKDSDDSNFDFICRIKVTVENENEILMLDAYKKDLEKYKNELVSISTYKMRFPVKGQNNKITWYESRMAYLDKNPTNTDSNKTLFVDDLTEIKNNNPNLNFRLQVMTKAGRPICMPIEKYNITNSIKFEDIVPKTNISDLNEPKKILIPMVGFHDPNSIGSHPNLGDEVFGFYIITDDEAKMKQYVDLEDFSYPGVIGYRREYGYYISI